MSPEIKTTRSRQNGSQHQTLAFLSPSIDFSVSLPPPRLARLSFQLMPINISTMKGSSFVSFLLRHGAPKNRKEEEEEKKTGCRDWSDICILSGAPFYFFLPYFPTLISPPPCSREYDACLPSSPRISSYPHPSINFQRATAKNIIILLGERERETQFLVILSFMDCDVAAAFTHDDLFTYLVFIGDDR